VQSNINWRQMDLTYTYSFLRGERYELGAGLGVPSARGSGERTDSRHTPAARDYSQAAPFASVALDGTI